MLKQVPYLWINPCMPVLSTRLFYYKYTKNSDIIKRYVKSGFVLALGQCRFVS